MKSEKKLLISYFLSILHPWKLLGSILFYFVGGGIIKYLGKPIDSLIFWFGLFCVLMLQVGSYFLIEYYDLPATPVEKRKNYYSADGNGERIFVQRNIFLQTALVSLTVWAAISFLLLRSVGLNITAGIFWGLSFLVMFFFASPPLRLAYSGYGEILEALFITNLIPAWAVILQIDELHSLLALTTFPLTVIFIAISLALSLEKYLQLMKKQRYSMLTRLGWLNGMNLHNILILLAFLMIVAARLAGLPWSLTWPQLVTLPLGVFQIFLVWQIGNGAKPNWKLLRITSIGLIGISTYLLAFSLWI